jgi:hypothetical protein
VAAAVLLTAWARVAPAAVPDATTSYVTPLMVAGSSGMAPGDTFQVAVRDVGWAPKAHALVTLNFTGTGMRLYQEQEASDSVDCAAHVLAQWSDSNGLALFHPRAGGFQNVLGIQVRANGVLLKTVPGRSTDINGDGATDIADLALFRENFLVDRSAPETDFDMDGKTTVRDLAILRAEFYSGARGTPCP